MTEFKSAISTTLTLFFVLILDLSPSNAQLQSGIDSRILESQERLPCLVCLEQIKPSTAGIQGKEAKARWVFELLKSNAQTTQEPVTRYLQALHTKAQPFYVVNCIASELSRSEAEEVYRLPGVRSIIYDWPIKQAEVEEETWTTLREPMYTWGIEMIGADIVQEMGYKGAGVTVGDQDTGVKWDVSSIKDKYRGVDTDTVRHDYHWYDGVHEISPLHNDSIIAPSNNPCGLKVPYPCDDHNHGTHTVGTMLGSEGDDIIGVAPEAEWMGCRCMERGWGSLQTYLRCFEFFLAPTDVNGENPRPEMAPSVINNSWTCPPVEGCDPTNYSVLEVAVENLSTSGVVVVASAGNDGRGGCSTIAAPGSMFEASLAVGATAPNDSIAGFSSRGPVMADGSGRTKPDVSAPGVGVRSQIRNGNYVNWNGTSMAGPHVAGLVALMISANPEIDGEVEAIKNIIKSTAVRKWRDDLGCDTITMQVPNNIYGWGRVDAVAAVEEAKRFISTSTNPTEFAQLQIVNPAQDEIRILASSPLWIDQVQIVDGLGREVGLVKVGSKVSTWTSSIKLKPASYWVLVSTEKGVQTLPLMVR